MSYPPTPTNKSCNCSDPCISTDDVYYAGPNLPNSGVNTNDILTTVIEKLDDIYATPTLQKVTEVSNLTTLPIIADSFVKIGGDGNNLLLDDGTVLPIGDLPTGVTETSQLINDGEDGINPFITALDIPAFNPSDYDLDQFTNTGIDPFAHLSDIPAPLGYTPVNKAGDTMLGDLILNQDPSNALGAATKQYVDNMPQANNYWTKTGNDISNNNIGEVNVILNAYNKLFNIKNSSLATKFSVDYNGLIKGRTLTIQDFASLNKTTVDIGTISATNYAGNQAWFIGDTGPSQGGMRVGVSSTYFEMRDAGPKYISVNNKIEYAADYSSSYVDRSLVDKGYINTTVKPYKVYTALLTRTGATAPSPTVLENTIGTITFSYSNIGVYYVNSPGSPGLFTLNKTTVFLQQQPGGLFGNNLGAASTSTNEISIVQATSSGTNDNNWTNPVSIEIRVYN